MSKNKHEPLLCYVYLPLFTPTYKGAKLDFFEWIKVDSREWIDIFFKRLDELLRLIQKGLYLALWDICCEAASTTMQRLPQSTS